MHQHEDFFVEVIRTWKWVNLEELVLQRLVCCEWGMKYLGNVYSMILYMCMMDQKSLIFRAMCKF